MSLRSFAVRALLIFFLGIVLMGYAAWVYFYTVPDTVPFRTPEENRDLLIAHGGGGIDGLEYTNSREAAERALENGFRFVELDLLVTSDKVIVAAHDWKSFNEMVGLPGDKAPSSADLRGRKIRGKYGILTASEINGLFAQYPEAYLVTDKIADYKLLREQLNFDRVIVETYSLWRYRRAVASGFPYPAFVMASERRLEKNWDELRPGRISIVSVPVGLLRERREKFAELYRRGVTIFAWTSNDREEILGMLNQSATAVYTDFVTPADLWPEEETFE